tara:strand:+ start:1846 stop:2157 length:312 start_codon:yes stop_codon:yes gene_type:complete
MIPVNHGVVRVDVRKGEFLDNCPGAEGQMNYDHVPLYDYEIQSGDPFLDDPVRRFTFLRDGDGKNTLAYIDHQECLWLEGQGIRIVGLLDLAEEGIEMIPTID